MGILFISTEVDSTEFYKSYYQENMEFIQRCGNIRTFINILATRTTTSAIRYRQTIWKFKRKRIMNVKTNKIIENVFVHVFVYPEERI